MVPTRGYRVTQPVAQFDVISDVPSAVATTTDAQSVVSSEVTALPEAAWHAVLDQFQDASIFQTIPFATATPGRQTVEHLVVRRGGAPVAAAQVRVIPVPLTGTSIAYVLWGPIYERKDSSADPAALRHALRALRTEYAVRRRMGVRVTPYLASDAAEHLAVFAQEGFVHDARGRSGRTVVIDLTPSLDLLRKGLDKKWRNCLNSAERNGLELLEGSEDSLFEPFLSVYRQMLARKRLGESSDIRSFRAMQAMLPDRYKMNVIVALAGGEPCAGAICSAIGRRGVYHFGGTADSGTRNKASYLVQWRAVAWLKERGCEEYDLHGINPEENPGVYAFKSGLCGRNGRELTFAGSFDACDSRGTKAMLAAANRVNREYKKLKSLYGRYRGFTG